MMTLNTIKDATVFLDTVKECKGDVKLVSSDGNVFNLKSELSGIIGIAEIINGYGYMLDLVCDDPEDEVMLTKMFAENPEMV